MLSMQLAKWVEALLRGTFPKVSITCLRHMPRGTTLPQKKQGGPLDPPCNNPNPIRPNRYSFDCSRSQAGTCSSRVALRVQPHQHPPANPAMDSPTIRFQAIRAANPVQPPNQSGQGFGGSIYRSETHWRSGFLCPPTFGAGVLPHGSFNVLVLGTVQCFNSL